MSDLYFSLSFIPYVAAAGVVPCPYVRACGPVGCPSLRTLRAPINAPAFEVGSPVTKRSTLTGCPH
jgi:hypothetical protein